LGLSTVYGFVKQSQGSLQLDSTPGVGTQVTLYLPAMQASSAQAAQTVEPTAPQQAAEVPPNLRVLLVEDDADVRAVAQAFLDALGCQVQACATAEQALQRLIEDSATFDVLFSDITLGAGLDGIELARHVHAQQPALAVLLCSGYSRFLSQAGGMAGSPPWPVLKKPYTQLELADAMAQCLSDQALQDQGQPRPR
jgi:CheY-like chemotaxis protein